MATQQTVTLPSTTINGSFAVTGAAYFATPFVTDSLVVGAAGIQSSKLQQQKSVMVSQPTGAVVSETRDVHIVRGQTGAILEVEVQTATAPVGTGGFPGTDRKFTVDVQVNSGSGFVTVLSAAITVDHTATASVPVDGAIVAGALVVGSVVRVIITATGSTGTQAQGCTVVVTLKEDAQ